MKHTIQIISFCKHADDEEFEAGIVEFIVNQMFVAIRLKWFKIRTDPLRNGLYFILAGL
jgi:hypothetical protein